MALRAIRTDLCDNGERNILRTDAGGVSAFYGNAHALWLLLPQRLRHQYVRHL